MDVAQEENKVQDGKNDALVIFEKKSARARQFKSEELSAHQALSSPQFSTGKTIRTEISGKQDRKFELLILESVDEEPSIYQDVDIDEIDHPVASITESDRQKKKYKELLKKYSGMKNRLNSRFVQVVDAS